MNLKLAHLCLGLVTFFFLATARLAESETTEVTARLVYDTATSATIPVDGKLFPGKSYRIGVFFTLKEPWHIYWKNPGDSGLPTRVTFTGAAGMSFSEPVFPTPVKFLQAGGVVGYGYEKEVLIWSTVTTTAPGTLTEIVATARWLACSPTTCIPGRASLASDMEPTNFEPWLALTPLNSAAQAQVEVRTIQKNREKVSFEVQFSTPVSEFFWAPELLSGVRIKHNTVVLQGENAGRVSFDLERITASGEVSAGESATPLVLPGVIVYRNSAGLHSFHLNVEI